MDDDLRTALVEYLDNELGDELFGLSLEHIAEEIEEHLNKKGYAFYDERGRKPVKL